MAGYFSSQARAVVIDIATYHNLTTNEEVKVQIEQNAEGATQNYSVWANSETQGLELVGGADTIRDARVIFWSAIIDVGVKGLRGVF